MSDEPKLESRVFNRFDAVGMLIVTATLAAVDSWRMLHGMGFVGDSIKFQFIGPTAGVGHETGNPVYLILVWLTSRVPVGDVGTRVNATSSLAMLIACVLLFLILRQLLVRRSIAVAFSIGLGLVPVALLYSVVAEVHTLHLALMTAILLTLLLWKKHRTNRYLYVLIALVAVSLGNHSTTVVLVPGILIFLWKVDRRKAFTVRTAAAAAVGVVGAVSVYYYLIWRAADPSAFYLELMPRSFWDLVNMWLGGRYRDGSMFNANLLEVATVLLPYLLAIFAVSFAVLIPFVVVGFRNLRGSVFRTTLVWWASGTLVFILAIGAVSGWVDPYLLPVMMALTVLAAVGAEQVARERVESRVLGAVLLATLVVLMAAPYPPMLGWTNWSEDTSYQQEVRGWLTDLPQDAVLAVGYRDAMASWYMMSIEDIQTDVEVLHLDGFDLQSDWYSILDDYLDGNPGYSWQLRRVIEAGRDVYAPTDDWMCGLVDAGFALVPFRPDVYRVTAKRGAAPPDERWSEEMKAICSEFEPSS